MDSLLVVEDVDVEDVDDEDDEDMDVVDSVGDEDELLGMFKIRRISIG